MANVTPEVQTIDSTSEASVAKVDMKFETWAGGGTPLGFLETFGRTSLGESWTPAGDLHSIPGR